MKTNKPRQKCKGTHFDKKYTSAISRAKGEEVGYFETGSTVVIIVECREGDVIHVKNGDRVKMGTPLMSTAAV